MKSLLFTLGISLSLLMVSCNTPTEPDEKEELEYLYKKHKKATGTVEVMKLGNNGSQSNDKIMIADFNAHEEHNNQAAHGTFLFSVLNIDSSPHRDITIDIGWVYVDGNTNKAWFKGIVTSDTKGCAGNGSGGHTGGCEGGGCSGDENGEHSEECSGQDGGHDSGCTGDDGEEHEGGCSGNGGQGGNGSGGTNGQNCRTGQILAVKVHDVGTPGTNGDGITWKWFDSDDPRVENLNLNNVNDWPHLCKKTILAGNLVVHN